MVNKIIFTPYGEYFGMGGPYLSKVEIDGIEFDGKFLDNNCCISENEKFAVFSRYSEKWYYYFQWQRKFVIQIINLDTKNYIIIPIRFSSLYIRKINLSSNFVEVSKSFFNLENCIVKINIPVLP